MHTIPNKQTNKKSAEISYLPSHKKLLKIFLQQQYNKESDKELDYNVKTHLPYGPTEPIKEPGLYF